MGLYRPTVTRKRKNGSRYKVKAGLWWGSFRHPVSDTLVRIPLKTGDKQAAATLLTQAERRAAQEAAGLVNPHDADHRRPLREHVSDYEQSLRDGERTEQYVITNIPRVHKVLEGCGFVYWGDLSRERLEAYLARLRRAGKRARTRNAYLLAFKLFLNWMVDHDRADSNPLARVKGLPITDEDSRRAPLPGELSRLVDAAFHGPVVECVPGPERAMLYLAAGGTGFRFNECRGLTWAHLDLDGPHPSVELSAAESKHRKADRQPLAGDTAEALGWWRAEQGSPPLRSRVFPHLERWHIGAKLLRVDLDAAEIPFRDRRGCKLVFHSLRDYYVTYVQRGTDAKTGRELARHGDPRLTAKYSHGIPADQYAAVNRMPKLWRQPAAEPVRATRAG